MAANEPGIPPAAAEAEAPSANHESAKSAESESGPWRPPQAQPQRIVLALSLTASGFALYGFVLSSFWSSSALGIHDRFPYPAYALIALALAIALAGLRVSLGIWSPHAKLGIGMLAFLACLAIGVGGGRFVSYTLRGTLNPKFALRLARGDRFPDFMLRDQHDAVHRLHAERMTLIVVYRGDFCPFARFELAALTARASELHDAGVDVIAISADPIDRSRKLAAFLRTDIPLLSDRSEALLAPLGLIQHHRDGRPDNSIPAYFLLDQCGVVRWLFTSPYYRELPRTEAVLKAAASVKAR